jgi:hypothetical protein
MTYEDKQAEAAQLKVVAERKEAEVKATADKLVADELAKETLFAYLSQMEKRASK